jgi:hypothetical protein
MSGIGEWFSSTLAKLTGKSPQEHADAVKSALQLPSDAESSKALGAAPEPSGTTITGGRRRRTHKRGGKKRKTRGRKH